MKTIKFFSLALLLSLAWVACKDTTNASTETATAEAVADSVFMAAKSAASQDLTNLKGGVAAKGALATADEAGKAAITTQLETFKKFLGDLETTSAKVSEATAETWTAVNTEVETVHFAVKSALTGTTSTDQIAK